jgi:hypothetical protein
MEANLSDLRSGTNKKFKKSFVLDADTLLRITGILEKYKGELKYPSTIVFQVQRDDELFYETTEIKNVLDDPNVGKRAVEYLSVDIRNSDPNKKLLPWEEGFIVRINFHKARLVKVGLWIYADDRKWALLLADELEPQIVRMFKCNQVPNWLLILFFLSVGTIATSWLPRMVGIHYVLDVLLNTIALFLWPALIVLSVFTYKASRPTWLAKIVGPEPVFLWGDQSDEYLKRERMRINILWGIVVAFIVSIIANIATSFIWRF